MDTTDPAGRHLELVWQRHRQWSRIADAGRDRLDRWRRRNLRLLVLGAVAAALAAQPWLPGWATKVAAAAATLALAFAALIQVNALTTDQTARWTQARSASEALKAEVHRYLIGVAPYAGADRARVLQARLDTVQSRVPPALLVDLQTTVADGRPLPAPRTFGEYLTGRARQQADWHRERCIIHRQQAQTLRKRQLTATGIGTVLSAVAVWVPAWGLSSWAVAATTIAAAIGTHLAATRRQQIAAGYASTAEQLDRLIAALGPGAAGPERQAVFVADVERVLLAQNKGWTDLLSAAPDTPPEPPAGRGPAPSPG